MIGLTLYFTFPCMTFLVKFTYLFNRSNPRITLVDTLAQQKAYLIYIRQAN